MNLFNDPIHEIKFEDVKKFCDAGTPESVKVDYKRELPKPEKLAKVISSFANTWGGIIIIGVEEENRIPKLPIKGIDNQGGYEEKITSICLSHINPPITPEIREIPLDETNKKCVILIRIAESDETPHRVENDTEIYIRDNSISHPYEKKAPWEAIEWLINKREKAIKNRERLIERAVNRFISSPHSSSASFYRQLIIVPSFPCEILFDYTDFERIIEDSQSRSKDSFSPPSDSSMISQNQSIIYEHFWSDIGKIVLKYAEINQLGLVFNKENFYEYFLFGEKDMLDINFTISHLIATLKFAIKFYANINYKGLVIINYKVEGIKDKKLYDYENNQYFSNQNDYGFSKYDKNFLKIKEIPLDHLIDKFPSVIYEFISELLWSCGAYQHALDRNRLEIKIQSSL